MKYKFEQFDLVIVNPTVDVLSATFNLKNGECSASVKLIESDGTEFGIELKDNSQPESWTAESLTEWVNNQLKKHETL